MTALRDGLREAGLQESTDFILDVRSAEGRPEMLSKLAQELGARHPVAFVVGGTVSVRAVRAVTAAVPVVALIGDFSASGWATEFARPGAGVTGVSFQSDTLDKKRMELLSQVLPKQSILLNLGDGKANNVSESALQAAARSLDITARTADARTIQEIRADFDTGRRAGRSLPKTAG